MCTYSMFFSFELLQHILILLSVLKISFKKSNIPKFSVVSSFTLTTTYERFF